VNQRLRVYDQPQRISDLANVADATEGTEISSRNLKWTKLFSDNVFTSYKEDLYSARISQLNSLSALEQKLEHAGLIPKYIASQAHEIVNCVSEVFEERQVTVCDLRNAQKLYRVACDPTVGNRVAYIESYSNGQLTQKVVAREYVEYEGIFFPHLYSKTFYDDAGAVRLEYECEILSAEFNRPLPEDLFELVLPDGTLVDDARNNIIYRVGSLEPPTKVITK